MAGSGAGALRGRIKAYWYLLENWSGKAWGRKHFAGPGGRELAGLRPEWVAPAWALGGLEWSLCLHASGRTLKENLGVSCLTGSADEMPLRLEGDCDLGQKMWVVVAAGLAQSRRHPRLQKCFRSELLKRKRAEDLNQMWNFDLGQTLPDRPR